MVLDNQQTEKLFELIREQTARISSLETKLETRLTAVETKLYMDKEQNDIENDRRNNGRTVWLSIVAIVVSVTFGLVTSILAWHHH